MRRDEGAFSGRKATVVLITLGTPDEAGDFCRFIPFTCLSDPEKRSHQAYGLTRGAIGQIVSGKTVGRLVLALAQGHGGGKPVGDPWQMPGVFIVDRQGIIRYAYRSRDISDNPPNEELFRVLDGL